MSSIIRPRTGIIVPRHIIKEEIDRQHRQDWEDADRYQRQKAKALRYVAARAASIPEFSWERLVRETARVFHDDLARDPDVRMAAQRACWEARTHCDGIVPERSDPTIELPRGEVRGVDESDESLASLEQQLHDEQHDG